LLEEATIILDWLNTKAALSLATIMLIGTAGIWYNSLDDDLKISEFEAMLDKFVSVINGVHNSQAYTKIKITHDQSEISSNSIYLEPLFNNEPYDIILTTSHAVFQQDDLRCSREFISTIQLIDPGLNDELDNFNPGKIILEQDLAFVDIVKLDSYMNLTIIKLILESDGFLHDSVFVL
jgi:hypothetical protein